MDNTYFWHLTSSNVLLLLVCPLSLISDETNVKLEIVEKEEAAPKPIKDAMPMLGNAFSLNSDLWKNVGNIVWTTEPLGLCSTSGNNKANDSGTAQNELMETEIETETETETGTDEVNAPSQETDVKESDVDDSMAVDEVLENEKYDVLDVEYNDSTAEQEAGTSATIDEQPSIVMNDPSPPLTLPTPTPTSKPTPTPTATPPPFAHIHKPAEFKYVISGIVKNSNGKMVRLSRIKPPIPHPKQPVVNTSNPPRLLNNIRRTAPAQVCTSLQIPTITGVYHGVTGPLPVAKMSSRVIGPFPVVNTSSRLLNNIGPTVTPQVNTQIKMPTISHVFHGVTDRVLDAITTKKKLPTAPPPLSPKSKAIAKKSTAKAPKLNVPVSCDQNSRKMSTSKCLVKTVSGNSNRDYRCNICVALNHTFAELDQHMSDAHNMFICQRCHASFSRQHDHENHLNIGQCEQNLNSERKFTTVIEKPIVKTLRMNRKDNGMIVSTSTQSVFICGPCELRFTSMLDYCSHAQSHAKAFTCRKCPNGLFRSEEGMRDHIRIKKNHNTEKMNVNIRRRMLDTNSLYMATSHYLELN